jgi:hypothetical protein
VGLKYYLIFVGNNKTNNIMENQKRPLYKIAEAISKDWGYKVNYAAKPYLQAMFTLTNIDDYYHMDSAKEIVGRFLSNAGQWRGETAREIKKELKALIGLK